ncbi:hypothetical protein [Halostreptopolyspora alba]|uniref:Uncharacterized protein n=1 Tax=Halostreptopolyspora alba TaxID=2487137 RepID=A0A3N0EG12_9ACTN|nr:hypothetical protein EFW17_02250 [Nocardiopsaceae bacterium YIM 96095]
MTDTTEAPGDELTVHADEGFPDVLSVVIGTEPTPLVASPQSGPPNRAALHVLMTNVHDEPLKAYAITIFVKVTKESVPQAEVLSEKWANRGRTTYRTSQVRTPSDDDNGTYTYTYTGSDNGSPFAPGESIELFVDDIPVSAQEGVTTVLVGIQAERNGETLWKYLPLGKFPTGYYLKELRADTNPVRYKEQTVLTWLAPPLPQISYKLYANGTEIPLDEKHPQPVRTGPLTTDTTFELVPSWATDVRHKQRLLVRVLNGDVTARDVTVNGNLGVTGKTDANGDLRVAGKTDANGDLTVSWGGTEKLTTSGVSDVTFPQGLTSKKRIDADAGILARSDGAVRMDTTAGTDVSFPQGLRADQQIYSTGDLSANGRILIGYSSNYDGMSPGDIWVMNKATIGYNAQLDVRGNLVGTVVTSSDNPTSFKASSSGILIGWIQVSHDSGKAASAELKATITPPGGSSFDITAWVDDDGNASSFSVPVNRGTNATFSVWKSSNLSASCIHKYFWLPFA